MDSTGYPLSGRLDYWRKDSPEAVLYQMFTSVSRKRKDGETCEFAFVYFTDKDYVGVTFMNSEEVAA